MQAARRRGNCCGAVPRRVHREPALTLEVDEALFVTFSPNGKKMVTTTRAGSAFVWSTNKDPVESKPILCNLEQCVTIQEPGSDGGYESYVCCFSPDSQYLLLTVVNVGIPVYKAGTAFAESGMQQVGVIYDLVFHLTSGMAWVTNNSFVGCVWDSAHQIITASAYSTTSTITENELFSFDCGPQKFIKSVVHLRVFRNSGENCYRVVAVVGMGQFHVSLHDLWGFSVPIASNSCSSKIPLDSGKFVDLNCLMCGMDLTPTRKRLVMTCTSWPRKNTHGLCDIQVYMYDPLALVCLLSFPSCQLVLNDQYHMFVGVNEDYLSW